MPSGLIKFYCIVASSRLTCSTDSILDFVVIYLHQINNEFANMTVNCNWTHMPESNCCFAFDLLFVYLFFMVVFIVQP